MVQPDNPINRFQPSTVGKKGEGTVGRTDDTKPRGAPESKEEFKKVFGKKEEKGSDKGKEEKKKLKEGEEGTVGGEVDTKVGNIKPDAKRSPVSLFDISKAASKKETEKFAAIKEAKEKAEEIETKLSSQFTQERPDLASVAPPTQAAQPFAAGSIEQVQQTARPLSSQAIEEILKSMTDAIQIVETKDLTQTTVTLNHPPMLEGAVLVINEFDSSQGQLNITFEGLTQEAKALLDLPTNRESLLTSLSSKGYTVQQFVTTTVVEHKPITPTPAETPREQQREGREQGEGGGGGQQGGKGGQGGRGGR